MISLFQQSKEHHIYGRLDFSHGFDVAFAKLLWPLVADSQLCSSGDYGGVVLVGLKPISVANWLPSMRCWMSHLLL